MAHSIAINHRLSVVLDTNVLLSGLAYPNSVPGKIVAAWRHGAIEVVLSQYILDELRRVLPRLSARHGLSAAEIGDLVDILAIDAEQVEPIEVNNPNLRDAFDQPILGTLISAQQVYDAQYLITGDKDLLALTGQYAILTPAEFWARHGDV
ncbi:MAG TPA: putative toxin-antitoxin system toxin component, PIN family [Halothiobacillus sp.]|jgi:putative PIN family toxin of toxin-antitoxin system|nr:putative toxin-antitoxin system toxin component, PIN family [Halothiobacillus sp.]HQT43053.1 putative toxin-antitoxin system toxin component, PIN family [Halothiobacillus sp.]